jgi:DNA repair exonuclease SbcCD ATPase subunit
VGLKLLREEEEVLLRRTPERRILPLWMKQTGTQPFKLSHMACNTGSNQMCCDCSHIRSLTERVERLGSKLLQSEEEKAEASARVLELESLLRERDGDLDVAERALRTANDEIKRLKRARRTGDEEGHGASSVELEEARSRISALSKELEAARGSNEGRDSASNDIRELRYSVEEKGEGRHHCQRMTG